MKNAAIAIATVSLAVVLLGTPALGHEVEESPQEEETKESARYTPTVRLIEESLPAVGSVQTLRASGTEGVFNMGVGSASVIDEAGYLLTNDHVVSGMAQGQVMLPGRPPMPFHIVARLSGEDLALIKVEAGEPLHALRLGRSDDLMLGEPVLTIGNPGGLVHSVSTGIVSGLNRSTQLEGAFLPWMIQISAAVSGGNSGGPLINAVGEQIGVITSKKMDGENISFAIAIDRVREVFPLLVSAELRFAYELGLEVEMTTPEAKVRAVKAGAPAERAGIVPGDVVKALGGREVSNGFDFQVALIGRAAGEKLEVELKREAEAVKVEVQLAELDLPEPVEEAGMVPGLAYQGFEGSWDQLPDFAALEPAGQGRAEGPVETAYASANRENYGLRFDGFIKIPREGLYTFYTASDDGSRLTIAGKVVVDNDGLHAVLKRGGLIRLPAGLHPVEVEFFEQGGDEKLEVRWEGPELEQEVIPSGAWFVRE